MRIFFILLLSIIINRSVYTTEVNIIDLHGTKSLDQLVLENELDENIDKDKTIILIYTHGQWGGDQKLNGCNRRWSKIPPAIYQLDGTKIKDLTIKTYQLCSGVRGWTQNEQDKFWATYPFSVFIYNSEKTLNFFFI